MEHRYDDLLTKVIWTIKNDYAGFPEKEEIHDSRYYVMTTGTAFKMRTLDELLFLRIVSQYLASLGDPNLKFSMIDHEEYQNYEVGFRVRRYKDDLYVTKVQQDTRLQVGDRIFSINKQTPGKHRERFSKNIVLGNTAEREQWNGFLKMADHFEVEHEDGTKEDLELLHYPMQQKTPALEFQSLQPDTCYLRIEEFSSDTRPLEELLKNHEEEWKKAKKLILDLRENAGGTESGFLPLLPFVLEEPKTWEQVLNEDVIYTNYSKTNCDRMLLEFRAVKAQLLEAKAEEEAAFLENLLAEYQKKSGSGFQMEEKEEVEEYLLSPIESMEKVVILTDTWCRDAGEVFVKWASAFKKVTVLGRPTMGTIDYTNSVTALLDQTFVLSYPMSKRAHVLSGIRYNESGLPVDQYLPWTPQECKEDLLLKLAMEMK